MAAVVPRKDRQIGRHSGFFAQCTQRYEDIRGVSGPSRIRPLTSANRRANVLGTTESSSKLSFDQSSSIRTVPPSSSGTSSTLLFFEDRVFGDP